MRLGLCVTGRGKAPYDDDSALSVGSGKGHFEAFDGQAAELLGQEFWGGGEWELVVEFGGGSGPGLSVRNVGLNSVCWVLVGFGFWVFVIEGGQDLCFG